MMADWQCTNVFAKNEIAKTRYVFNEGGTRSSKSFSILQLLYRICQLNPNANLIISVVSETMPHLKRGVMTDFFDKLLKPHGLYIPKNHNKTDNFYICYGNKIEFFSADTSDKVHGPARDILFYNEIQNSNYETFFQLVQRTSIQVYADWNPTHEFWVHSQFLADPAYKNDITYIHSTYKDNHLLPETIVKDILRRAAKDENYKRVYVDGIIGSIEGLIFSNFELINELPKEYAWRGFGMDFGYTNDPSTVIEVIMASGAIYLNECIYETGLVNQEIGKKLSTFYAYPEEIIADSSEQKSIDELFLMGFNIHATKKFPGSVKFGIQLAQNYSIFVTKNSVNLIKELRNYKWAVDKNGKSLNEPIDMFNHAIDAVRYCLQHKLTEKKQTVKISNTYRNTRMT